MSDFHPLEVVGRVSETQFQVGVNLNYNDFIWRFNGQRNEATTMTLAAMSGSTSPRTHIHIFLEFTLTVD